MCNQLSSKSARFSGPHFLRGLGRWALLVMVLVAIMQAGPARADATETSDGLPKCPKTTLAVNLRAGTEVAVAGSSASIDEMYKSVMEAEAQKPPKDERGNIEDAYCLARVVKFFDNIGDLIGSILDQIISTLVNMIVQIINAACQAVATIVNNLLSSLCIPIPSLNFGLSLPSIERKSCDGLSLASFIQLQAGTPFGSQGSMVPSNYLSGGLTRWINGSTTTSKEIMF